MTPQEAAALLTIAAAYDNRKPDADAAKAWAMALDGLRFVDCRDAVVAHYRVSSEWLMPDKVIAEVKRMRAKRISLAGDLCPPPGPEGETEEALQQRERAWLTAARRRIGDGETREQVESDYDYGELRERYLPDIRQLLPSPKETA